MSKPNDLGGISHTCQKYDPVPFPSLTAPSPDLLLSSHCAERWKCVPKAGEKVFEVNPGESAAVRASCVVFVLVGLYSIDRISRLQKQGRTTYEIR